MIIGELLDPGCIAPRVAVSRQASGTLRSLPKWRPGSFGLKAPKVFDTSDGARSAGRDRSWPWGRNPPRADHRPRPNARGFRAGWKSRSISAPWMINPSICYSRLLAPKGQGSEHSAGTCAGLSRIFRKVPSERTTCAAPRVAMRSRPSSRRMHARTQREPQAISLRGTGGSSQPLVSPTRKR